MAGLHHKRTTMSDQQVTPPEILFSWNGGPVDPQVQQIFGPFCGDLPVVGVIIMPGVVSRSITESSWGTRTASEPSSACMRRTSTPSPTDELG